MEMFCTLCSSRISAFRSEKTPVADSMTNSKISPTNAAILMLRAIFPPFLRNATVSSTTPRQIKPVVDSVLRMVTISSAIAQQYFFLLMPMRVSSLIRNSSAKFRKIWKLRSAAAAAAATANRR